MLKLSELHVDSAITLICEGSMLKKSFYTRLQKVTFVHNYNFRRTNIVCQCIVMLKYAQ